MGAREELTEVQTALETARGAAARPLLLREERLLRNHGEELSGPGPALTARMGSWREGYLAELLGAPTPQEEDPPLNAAFELAHETLAHPAMRRLRRLKIDSWHRNLPETVEHLALMQAVITRGLLALPRLRSLSIFRVVDCVSLAMDQLEHLAINPDPPILHALTTSELPALRSVEIDRVDGNADVQAILAALLAHPRVDLALHTSGKIGALGRTGDYLSILEPIWPSVTTLGLTVPLTGFAATLPSVRALHLRAMERGTRPWSLPALPALSCLKLKISRSGVGRDGLFDKLCAYGEGLEQLHLSGWDPQLLENFLARPLSALEELTLEPNSRDEREYASAFAAPAFERVRTVSVGFSRFLAPLAESPLASQLTTVSAMFFSERCVRQWLDVRHRFPNVKLLVLRPNRGVPVDALAELYEQGHDIAFGNWEAWYGVPDAPGSNCHP